MTDTSHNDPRSRAAAAARARLGANGPDEPTTADDETTAEEGKEAVPAQPQAVVPLTVGASRRQKQTEPATARANGGHDGDVSGGTGSRSGDDGAHDVGDRTGGERTGGDRDDSDRDDSDRERGDRDGGRGGRRRGARPDRGPHSWRRVATGLAVLSVVLVAALATSLVTLADRGTRVSNLSVALASESSKSSGYENSQSALAAAKTYAVELSSYNYTQLSKDFATVLAHSTPTFKANYTKSSSGLDKVLAQYKATATGTVLAAGVSSASATQAVVLVFVNQKVSNSTQKKGPTTDESRIEMTLDRSKGTWLIDKVQLL